MSLSVLSVASECVPLVKTGGLADVVGALPGALLGEGVEMRVLLPAYPGVEEKCERIGAPLWGEADLIGGPAEVVPAQAGALELLLLRAPHFFARPGGPYGAGGRDHPDNPERFAALSWAGAAIAARGLPDGWRPQILHAHDWQAGLAPWYLRAMGGGAKSVLTIHNIAFQGLADRARMPWLRLAPEGFTPDGFEYWGRISALKAGLVAAGAITTVSPTYAGELMRPEFGLGLEGVLARRAADLHGILNGADTALWDPALTDDPRLATYSTGDLVGKALNRERLLQEFGLGPVAGPLAVLISRMTGQKGIDLIPAAVPGFLRGGGGLIVLGSGEARLEQAMLALAADWPDRVAVRIGYDEALSRRMFAGGDAVLVPSRFEPCGLTQMYGLRYGTVPVVAATGGLADTVIDANHAAISAGVATGIQFHPTDALALAGALRRLSALHASGRHWEVVQQNAMSADVGWSHSAAAYAELYRGLPA